MPKTTLNKLYKRTTTKVGRVGVLGKLSPSVLSAKTKQLQSILLTWIFSFPNKGGTSLMAIKDIHLDLERFQNRLEEYSEESVKKIVANYDSNRFDPVMLWFDPKKLKTYLLSGHSRLEAMKRRKETLIPCRFFEGSESEAILYAKSFSNRAGTAEGLLSDIKAFRLERDGTDKVQKLTQARLKDNWGSRYNKLNAFTYLNAKGKFLEYLSTEGRNSFPYIENRAYNVGLWRKNFPQISNVQENEIFDYWYGKGANLSLEEMTNKISRAVMRLDFDPDKPLHLEKGATGLEARADTAEAQKRLFEIEDELKAIKFKVREAFTQAEKDALRKEVESLLAEKERIERNVKIVTKTQQSLFGLRKLKLPRKTPSHLKRDSKAITFRKIDYQTAYNAYRGISFSPEKRAKDIVESEWQYLRAVYFKNEGFARKDNRVSEYNSDFNSFQNKYTDKVIAWLHALSRVLSSMITGPSNFPVRRNEKRLSTEHKRMEEVLEYAKKGEGFLDTKYNPKYIEQAAIKTGASDSLEKLQQQLAMREKAQRQFVEINKAIREGLKKKLAIKDIIARVNERLAEADKVEDKMVMDFLKPDFTGGIGVPSYTMTNNNAEIARLKKRIQAEELYKKRVDKEYTFEGGKALENYEDNRFEIYFDSIPLQEIRNALKKRGFKWTPTKGAWQKQMVSMNRTEKHAIWDAESVVGKLVLVEAEQVTEQILEPSETALTPSNLENMMNEIEQDLEATLTKKRANKFSRKTPVHLKKGKGLAQIVDKWKHAFRQVLDVQVPVDISVLIGYYQNYTFKDLHLWSNKSFRHVWVHAQIAKFMYANGLYNEKDAGKSDRLELLKAIVSDDVYMEWLDSEFIKRGLDYQIELYLNTTGSKIIPD